MHEPSPANTSEASPAATDVSRAWFSATIVEFARTSSDEIIGRLTRNCGFPVRPTDRASWLCQIEILRSSLVGRTGTLMMEFAIPRMGRRIDVVLLIGPVVFAIEFKVGQSAFERS